MVEDVIIVGSGPAAYCASLYSKTKKPLLFTGGIIGGVGPGGQLTTTTNVDNYPGFPKGVQGPDLMSFMSKHANMNGVKQLPDTVEKITKEDDIFIIETDEGTYKSRSVIIGTGASARRLYVPGTGDNEFWQKGISSCAICDGYFFMEKVVCVIGGGDAAMEEALYLSKICKRVYIIHRREGFRARADKLEEAKKTENIELFVPYTLVSAHGDKVLRYIVLEDTSNKEKKKLDVDGMFFGIGHDPNSKFLEFAFPEMLDEDKYIIADEKMRTSILGLFACGDVCDKKYKQAVTAAASGCIAGKEAINYLKK